MKFYIIAVLSIITFFETPSSDAVIGEYMAEDETGKITIFKCGDKYCGRISWRVDDKKDTNNPDKSKRNRSVVGIQVLNDFNYNASEKIWDGGTLYSIDNGKTYKGKIWLENNGATLKMRGFLGFSLIGKTATFKRVN